jgi:hypothetical protein
MKPDNLRRSAMGTVVATIVLLLQALYVPYAGANPQFRSTLQTKRQADRSHLAGGVLVRFSQDPNPDEVGPFLNQEPIELLRFRQESRKLQFETTRQTALQHIFDSSRGEVLRMDVPVDQVEATVEDLELNPDVEKIAPVFLYEALPEPTTQAPDGYKPPVKLEEATPASVSKATIGFIDAGINLSDFSAQDLWSDLADQSVHGYTVLNKVITTTPQESGGNRHGSGVFGIAKLTYQHGATIANVGSSFQGLMVNVYGPNHLASSDDIDVGYKLILDKAKADFTLRTINMSIGDFNFYDPFWEEMAAEFSSIGGITTTAAGNGVNGVGKNIDLTVNPFFPASSSYRVAKVVSVAAVQPSESGGYIPTAWTNYGSMVTTYGLGVGVDAGISLFLTGTSAAAPQVASEVALLLASGRPAADVMQALIFSADPNSDIPSGVKVIQGGGVMNLQNALVTQVWVQQIRTPATLSLGKVKPGKLLGSISDPTLSVYLAGYLNVTISVQSDGSFTKKNPGLDHSPVWASAPLGWVVTSGRVKGL